MNIFSSKYGHNNDGNKIFSYKYAFPAVLRNNADVPHSLTANCCPLHKGIQ